MPEDEQLELIDAHPRLGAPPATRVRGLSFREQGYDRDTTEAIAELDRLNAAYEARFGFRYCVFVAGRSRRALVPVMEAALSRRSRLGDPARARRRRRDRPRPVRPGRHGGGVA